MNFMVLPPEVNSARIYASIGAGPDAGGGGGLGWAGRRAGGGSGLVLVADLRPNGWAGFGVAGSGGGRDGGRGRTVSELAERGDGTR
ncbi:hypothetical protein [Mycobacterium canettii]|uniref:hypothetical protein n=1 Tax=Mycobacterium canetti TaxID=78331 RepID=UPI0002A5645F|nr:Conserved protein of unknown function, PPE family, PPE13 (part2) [Mycobacterium canettii CIPT 140070008]